MQQAIPNAPTCIRLCTDSVKGKASDIADGSSQCRGRKRTTESR